MEHIVFFLQQTGLMEIALRQCSRAKKKAAPGLGAAFSN